MWIANGKWSWTPADVDVLIDMINKGYSYNEIVRATGCVSRNSVASKVSALRASGRLSMEKIQKSKLRPVILPRIAPNPGNTAPAAAPKPEPKILQAPKAAPLPISAAPTVVLQEDLVEALVALRTGYYGSRGWEPGHCKWITGDVRDGTAHFCDAPSAPPVRGRGGVYCAKHTALARSVVTKKPFVSEEDVPNAAPKKPSALRFRRPALG